MLFSPNLVLSRCYNYWFWVPLVAPLIGAVMGSFLYLIFIDWQLPDLEQPENLPAVSTISDKINRPRVKLRSSLELKA